jgi:hypothetical protein
VDSLKVLDPERPIREADISEECRHVRFVPLAEVGGLIRSPRRRRRAATLLSGAVAAWPLGVQPLAAQTQMRRSARIGHAVRSALCH